jgi:hypothetical protein
MPVCPNCRKSRLAVHSDGWLTTVYRCENPECMKQGQVFSERTWFGAGAAAVAVVGWKLVSSQSPTDVGTPPYV